VNNFVCIYVIVGVNTCSQVVNKMVDTKQLNRLLCSLGMIPHDDDSLLSMTSHSWFSVLLDGRVVGQVPAELAESFVMTLRRLKVTGSEGVS